MDKKTAKIDKQLVTIPTKFLLVIYILLLINMHLIQQTSASSKTDIRIGVLSDRNIETFLQWTKTQLESIQSTNSWNISFEIISYNATFGLDLLTNVCNVLPLHAIADFTSDINGYCLSASIAQYIGVPHIGAFNSKTSVSSCVTPVESNYFRYSRVAYSKAHQHFLRKQNVTSDSLLILYDKDAWDAQSLITESQTQMAAYFVTIPSNRTDIEVLMKQLDTQSTSGIVIVAANWDIAYHVLETASSNNLINSYRSWFYFSSDLVKWNLTIPESVYYLTPVSTNTSLLNTLQNKLDSSNGDQLKSDAFFVISIYDSIKAMMETITTTSTKSSGFNSTFQSGASNCTAGFGRNISEYYDTISSISLETVFSDSVKMSRNGPIHPNLTISIKNCKKGICSDTNMAYVAANDQITAFGVINNVTSKSKLKVLVLEEPPFVFLENGKYIGYSVAVLDYITNKLGYQYELITAVEGTYGVRQNNGSWNGIIGQIVRREADVALGPISVTSERETVIDFTIPYYDYAGLQILMKRQTSSDGSSSTGMFFFVTVFNGWVWLCVAATLVLTGILVTLFDKWSPYSFQNRLDDIKEGEPEGKIFTFKESMWFALGAYTQAGESFDPRATSTRLLVAGFWIFACIMMALYTANLAAFLTVSKLTTSISTVRELAAQTDIKYSVQKDTIGYSFFERMKFIESKFYDLWRELSLKTGLSPDQLSQYSVWEYPIEERYTDMFQRMSDWGFINTTADALKKVRQENWAIFTETPMIKYYMSKDCNLINTGGILSSRPYGIVLQNNSPLTTDFNTVILEMQRDRILENYKVKWWEREKIFCPKVETANGIKLDTLGGVFIFLAGGIGVGFVLLLVELIIAKIFGTERFKDNNNIITTHLDPKPAISRSSLRSLRSIKDDGIERCQTIETSLSEFPSAKPQRQSTVTTDQLQSIESIRNSIDT